MDNNINALQNLYVAFGGNAEDVANCTTSVEVMNAISVLLGGEGGAILNPEAINNIAQVASGGGSVEVIDGTLAEPFSMEIASELCEKCNQSAPSAMAVVYVTTFGGVFPLVVQGDNDPSGRTIKIGVAGYTSGTAIGIAAAVYVLDNDLTQEPLDAVGLTLKALYSISTEEGHSVQDMSAVLANSSVTKTLIVRFKEPVPIVDENG